MSTTATSAPARRVIEVVPGRTVAAWLLLTLVCVGQFMVVLDVSIVNVALPSIQKDLGFSGSGLQWVVNAYTLTFAGFMLLGGRAADIFGRRRIFIAGLAIFTVSSLIGGFSPNQAMLIGARALQGFGAAILAPATLTIITATFTEPATRARALGVWSAVASAGASAGALLGGILVEFLSWRWILFVNVPIGLAALVFASRLIPESRADLEHRQLDVAGALTVTGGLVALVYAIVRTQTYAWTNVHTLTALGDRGRAARHLLLDPDPFAGSARPASHLPLAVGGRWERGDLPPVRGDVRLVVLRDPLHAAGARVQPAPGGTRLLAADPADRCRCPDHRSLRHPGGSAAPDPARQPGRRERSLLALADHPSQLLRRRSLRALRPDRSRVWASR